VFDAIEIVKQRRKRLPCDSSIFPKMDLLLASVDPFSCSRVASWNVWDGGHRL